MVTGLPLTSKPKKLCEIFPLNKKHGDLFASSISWKPKKLLEIVHSHIFGSLEVPSIGGKGYYLTFIYDFNKKACIYS